jgi:hypothetical protein
MGAEDAGGARTAAHERAEEQERDLRAEEARAEREHAEPGEPDRELSLCARTHFLSYHMTSVEASCALGS